MAQQRQLGTAAFDHPYQAGPTTDHRIHLKTPTRIRTRPLKPPSSRRHRRPAVTVAAAAILVAVTVFLAFRLLSSPSTPPNGNGANSDAEPNRTRATRNWRDWRNPNPKELRFGMGGGARSGRDSRDWDRDDRRRDQDYTEEESSSSASKREEKAEKNGVSEQKVGEDSSLESGKGRKDEGLYNEGGRKELEEYEAMTKEVVNPEDEYDDGMDGLDELEENANGERKLESGSRGGSRGGGGGDHVREIEKDAVLETNAVVEGVSGEIEDGGKKKKEKKEKSGTKKKFKRKKSGC